MKDKELVQYYIVNKDLPMSQGKIAGQVAHVARRSSDWYRDRGSDGHCEEIDTYYRWIDVFNEKKIILQAHEEVLRKLKDKGCFYVEDSGLTEIPQGSLTVVALKIMTREEASSVVKRLQTLK